MNDQSQPTPQEASDEAARRAAARISFRLTYDHTSAPRRIGIGSMSGPPIPCAYGGKVQSSGEWDAPDDGQPRDEAGWLDQFLSYVVGETVHEGLEHYQVDGRPWLDPHGPAEAAIHAAVDRLHADLAAIRRRFSSDQAE
ncbi:hypothetical protein [Catellatospora methionotrophica]|uniref:hypothetical protein n=1 Tax=Catellatospora methionotrophica TaxID=121620 RepID=UPI0033CC7285